MCLAVCGISNGTCIVLSVPISNTATPCTSQCRPIIRDPQTWDTQLVVMIPVYTSSTLRCFRVGVLLGNRCLCCIMYCCTGQVWPAVNGGGPSGSLPPHSFKVLFKEGGIGTFYPMFYALCERARKAHAAARQPTSLAQNTQAVQELVHKA